MGKSIGKKYKEKIKYSQKIIEPAKQSATDSFKTNAKKGNSKNSRGNWWFIDTKVAEKITNVPRSLPQNSIETVKSETENIGFDKKYLKKNIYIQKGGSELMISWY